MSNRRAVPQTPPEPTPDPVRKYRILGRRCIWGRKGEVIERAFRPGVELALIQAGTLERVPDEQDRPLKSADKEG